MSLSAYFSGPHSTRKRLVIYHNDSLQLHHARDNHRKSSFGMVGKRVPEIARDILTANTLGGLRSLSRMRNSLMALK
jgi:hypothetical protein